MERLTIRLGDGTAIMKSRGLFNSLGVELLAAYEDTGVTPGEVYGLNADLEIITKVNMRLLAKFADALRVEYGETAADIMRMIDTLYREQCEVMPLPWNEYCLGRKEGGDHAL